MVKMDTNETNMYNSTTIPWMYDTSTTVPWMDDIRFTMASTTEASLSLQTYPERVVTASILLLISLINIIGNSMVILAVVFSKKLRTSTNVFVVSLSSADLLAGVAAPMSAVALLSPGDHW